MNIFNKKSLNLIRELTVSELKLRDQGSLLGFVWTLLHPFLMFVVLYLIFSKWTGRDINNFSSYLLVSIIQWNFFATATTLASTVIERKRDLVKNLNFPKEILIISSVFSVLSSHLMEFLVLLPFLFFMGVTFSRTALILPVIIFIQLVLIIAVSFFIASAFVYYRDIERIWGVFIKIGFFLTPIVYPVSMLSKDRQIWVLLNPMTHIINSTRSCLLFNAVPPVLNLSLTFLFSVALFFIGYAVFRKLEAKFAEVL